MSISVEQVSKRLREIYRQDTEHAAEKIDLYLDEALADMPTERRSDFIDDVAENLGRSSGPPPTAYHSDHQLRQFASLLLGQSIDDMEMDDGELPERLHDSLSAIFNGLNQLLLAINQTMSRDGLMEETIRQVVRGQLAGDQRDHSLESYIDQIKEAFFTSYESFKSAHLAVVEKILGEMEPGQLSAQSGRGLVGRLGPLRRAESYDQFVKVYEDIKSWHESGRGLEEYLRVFETKCGESLLQQKEGSQC